TLVELIVVIAILAILAATAIPRFVDLSSNALSATANGIAGAVASGGAVNYAAHLASAGTGTNVNSCAAATALVQGGWPAAASIFGDAGIANGAMMSCQVQYTSNGQSAIVTIHVVASSA